MRTFHETLIGSGRHHKIPGEAAVSLYLDHWTPDGASLVVHHGAGGGVTSLETGRAEIMVATFPAFTERRQISTDGGVQPLWRLDGRELFFVALSPSPMLMAVEVKAGATFDTGQARRLFATPIVRATGSMFFTATGPAVESLHVITNWTSLLGH